MMRTNEAPAGSRERVTPARKSLANAPQLPIFHDDQVRLLILHIAANRVADAVKGLHAPDAHARESRTLLRRCYATSCGL